MNLGLKKEEVRLVKYTSEWNIEYNRVKREIVESLNIEGVRVEHIGSTQLKEYLNRSFGTICSSSETTSSPMNKQESNMKRLNRPM